MPTNCLICCQEAQYFLLPPCNHKEMCWKCSLTLIQGSTFTCPYCNGTPQGTSSILFVSQSEMVSSTFQQIFKRNPFKSSRKSYQFYSNEQVAQFIQQSTSYNCRLCSKSFDSINFLKKHLNQTHRKQFCDVCLQNRRCLLSEQYLYTDGELTMHFKKGEYSHENELILYHPWCQFCKTRFYDIDAFRAHLRMSSHMQCTICQQNFPKFKYIYYKDYTQIQRHFYQSHFVCDVGACVGNKLQNVFVSQQVLDQHKSKAHGNKGGNKNNKQVHNLLLFAEPEDQNLDWDKIGRDFSKEFTITEKSYQLKNQEHKDSVIDIREFYPQLTKPAGKLTLEQIRSKLQQYLFRTDYKSDVISFNSVYLFRPLEMSSLTRLQLERYLRQIYEPKYSEPIIQIFFTRKFEYRSQNQYFQDVRRKMLSFSPISYYYVFPQLVRYFRDTNKTKQNMDTFYAQSLRSLTINNIFIFHKKQRYTDILNIMQDRIQQYLYQLMIQQKIDLAVYEKYLKDLNPQFYLNCHDRLFYVQKQKIKNMYHMVQKTKTSQLLKLNWLLKLGLSSASHRAIFDRFFYKTLQTGHQWVHYISIQQLALVYAYIDICLQAIIDKKLFQTHKSNPQALFLGTTLSKIKTCISNKQLTVLRQIQLKSVQLSAKLNTIYANSTKRALINQQDHPSLLTYDDKDKKVEEQITIFGQNINIPTNSHVRVHKKNYNNKEKVQEQKDDFPELIATKKVKQSTKAQNDDQQFPVYNYKEKNNPEQKKPKKKFVDQQQQNSNLIKKLDLFNPKSAFPSKKFAQQYYETPTNNNKESDRRWDEDWPTLSQEKVEVEPKSTKKKKQNKEVKQVSLDETQATQPQQIVQEVCVKKKTKQQLKAEQQQINKKKGKKNKQSEIKDETNQVETEKSKQQPPPQNKPKTKKKVRLDATDSEQQQRQIKQQKQKQRQQKFKKFSQQQKIKTEIKYNQGFDSLLQINNNKKQQNGHKKEQKEQKSIVNKLIEQSKVIQQEAQIVIKKGKKGKAVVIEKVNFWNLK